MEKQHKFIPSLFDHLGECSVFNNIFANKENKSPNSTAFVYFS